LKDTKAFVEAVISLFTNSATFSKHFATVFRPIAGEFDILGKYPEATRTSKNVDKYEAAMEELRSSISPELELIESRVVGPMKEFQAVLKLIRKSITKRDHKLTDYDRFNNSLTKLRDKKEKSLSDEKNLFKLEQDFELATNEYDYINNAMKTDLPRFMAMATQFVDPLFHSFFYMQLNIFYVFLEKINTFAEDGKFDIANTPGEQIAADYEQNRTDAWKKIEDLNIIKRIISVAKLVQANRSQTGALGRTPSFATTSSSGSALGPPPARSTSSVGFKKAPPPPPSASNPPPPYAAKAEVAATTAASKRPPPPPPPLKPKPKPELQYVTALYDFVAQASGDLSFKTGDRIEIVERTGSTEDWWTGKLNGRQGVFPGNYVQNN